MRAPWNEDDFRYCDALERLTHALQALAVVRGREDLARVVRRAIRDMTQADAVSFVLHDGTPCHDVDEEAAPSPWSGREEALETCISALVMAQGEGVIIDDLADDSRVPWELCRETFVKSLVMVPLRTLAPVGVIGVYWAAPRTALDWEVRLLQVLADAAVVTLDALRAQAGLEEQVRQRTEELEAANRRLAVEGAARHQAEEEARRLSLTDGQTGLANRRGFFVQAETLLKQSRREDREASVLFIDVNGLKTVNDYLGHERGDALLQDAAKVLRDVMRESDVLGRLGGDEFVILAVSDRPDRLQGRLQGAVEVFNDVFDRPYRLSFSVGTAHVRGYARRDLEQAMASARQAMTQEKRHQQAAGQGWGAAAILRPSGMSGRSLGFGASGEA